MTPIRRGDTIKFEKRVNDKWQSVLVITDFGKWQGEENLVCPQDSWNKKDTGVMEV